MLVGKKKDGQLALEFGNKYGLYIIMGVIIISALIYFDLLNVNRFMPEYCKFSEGLSCEAYSVSENGIGVLLRNDMTEDIVPLGLMEINTNCETQKFQDGIWKKGQTRVLTLSGCNLQKTGIKQKFIFKIYWRFSNVDIRQTTDGVIYAKVE